MSKIVIISGSPTDNSRLFALTDHVTNQLEVEGHEVKHINVSELPADALVRANFRNSEIIAANELVAQADAIIIASPVYKAAYTGILKAYLDLLPQKGFENKITLPLFIGGTLAHLLAIEYSLKPLVHILGGYTILPGVFAIDEWVDRLEEGGYHLKESLVNRLTLATNQLHEQLLKLQLKVTVLQ